MKDSTNNADNHDEMLISQFEWWWCWYSYRWWWWM